MEGLVLQFYCAHMRAEKRQNAHTKEYYNTFTATLIPTTLPFMKDKSNMTYNSKIEIVLDGDCPFTVGNIYNFTLGE